MRNKMKPMVRNYMRSYLKSLFEEEEDRLFYFEFIDIIPDTVIAEKHARIATKYIYGQRSWKEWVIKKAKEMI